MTDYTPIAERTPTLYEVEHNQIARSSPASIMEVLEAAKALYKSGKPCGALGLAIDAYERCYIQAQHLRKNGNGTGGRMHDVLALKTTVEDLIMGIQETGGLSSDVVRGKLQLPELAYALIALLSHNAKVPAKAGVL